MKYLLACLGNPGKKYQHTRHNAAWMMSDELFGATGWEESSSTQALYKWQTIAGQDVEIIKPLSYMNRSGEVVKTVARKHGLAPRQIIVMHDDLDFPSEEVRYSFSKSAGGHNGVQSVIDSLGSKDFHRLRLGIGPTTLRAKTIRSLRPLNVYVLSKFSADERAALIAKKDRVLHLLESIVIEDKNE